MKRPTARQLEAAISTLTDFSTVTEGLTGIDRDAIGLVINLLDVEVERR